MASFYLFVVHLAAYKKNYPKELTCIMVLILQLKKLMIIQASLKPIRKSLEDVATPQKNKMILGYPYKVGIWYFVGETKNKLGLNIGCVVDWVNLLY